MTTSTNPNETSGRASKSVIQIRYPLNEDLPTTTLIKFSKYSRLSSDADLTEEVNTIISLPLPITIPDTSSIQTRSHDMGTMGNITSASLTNMANNISSLKGGNINIDNIINRGASEYNNAIKDGQVDSGAMLKMLALTPKSFDFMPRETASVFAGVVSNPHVTTMFEGVNLKQYHLEWRLSPRSEDESEVIRSIVDRVKLCAHPDEILGGYALDYPDLCYVEFTGKPAEYLPKFQRSFVTSIVASPDSAAGLAFFKSGAPTAINLQLSFVELNIVTRKVLREQQGS